MSHFEDFAERVHNELVPMIKDSSAFISIVPIGPDRVDVKFAVELGVAIMLNKPIIACIQPGTKVPDKLVKVADKIVELDLDDPTQRERLNTAISEVISNESES